MGNCQDTQLQPYQTQGQNQGSQTFLKVTGITWLKDSHGLFDYQTSNTIKTQIDIKESGRIIRKNSEIHFQQEEQVQNEDEEILLTITRNEYGFFSIKQNETINEVGQQSSSSQWTVVKHISNEDGYKIREGDLFKLGRVVFKVKKMVLADQQKMNSLNQFQKKQGFYEYDNADVVTDFDCQYTQNMDQQHSLNQRVQLQNSQNELISDNFGNLQIQSAQNNNNNNDELNQQKICRICLSEALEQNPLINPCKCQGTMKYIHLGCLQTWVIQKTQSANKSVECPNIIFMTKQQQCELCKANYSNRFQSDGVWYDLEELAIPKDTPYVIVDSQQSNINRSNQSGTYIITLNPKQKQSFNIGRSVDSEIRIIDISVSRSHASLNWNGEQLFLEDKDSKFGSLVQVNQEIPLTGDMDGFGLQCGRTTVQFHILNNSQGCQVFKNCCSQLQSSQMEELNYNIQQE